MNQNFVAHKISLFLFLFVLVALFPSISGLTDVKQRNGLAMQTTEPARQEQDVVKQKPTQFDRILFGKASWYGFPFHGRKTANGEWYNMHTFTAAHKQLAFNSLVRVTNLKNGESVVVRINDRGPYIFGRQIDLSYGAAKQLGMVTAGVVPVKMEVLNHKKAFALINSNI